MRTAGAVLILACALLSGACVSPVATVPVADALSTPTPTIAPPSTLLPASATPERMQPTLAPTPDALPPGDGTPAPEPSAQPEPGPENTPHSRAEDAPAGSARTAEEEAALLALGADVYRRQACGVCHKLSAIGSEGIFGPPHDNLAAIAAQRVQDARYHGAATSAETYIRESIVDPLAFLVEGYQITRFPMPVFTNLSPQELDALVYLLLHN